MFSLKEIAKRVRYLRTLKTEYKSNFDVFRFYDVIGIEAEPYNSIEYGSAMPSECNLLTIAEFYKVSPEWLLTGFSTCEYEEQLNEEFRIEDEINEKYRRQLEEELGIKF